MNAIDDHSIRGTASANTNKSTPDLNGLPRPTIQELIAIDDDLSAKGLRRKKNIANMFSSLRIQNARPDRTPSQAEPHGSNQTSRTSGSSKEDATVQQAPPKSRNGSKGSVTALAASTEGLESVSQDTGARPDVQRTTQSHERTPLGDISSSVIPGFPPMTSTVHRPTGTSNNGLNAVPVEAPMAQDVAQHTSEDIAAGAEEVEATVEPSEIDSEHEDVTEVDDAAAASNLTPDTEVAKRKRDPKQKFTPAKKRKLPAKKKQKLGAVFQQLESRPISVLFQGEVRPLASLDTDLCDEIRKKVTTLILSAKNPSNLDTWAKGTRGLDCFRARVINSAESKWRSEDTTVACKLCSEKRDPCFRMSADASSIILLPQRTIGEATDLNQPDVWL